MHVESGRDTGTNNYVQATGVFRAGLEALGYAVTEVIRGVLILAALGLRHLESGA